MQNRSTVIDKQANIPSGLAEGFNFNIFNARKIQIFEIDKPYQRL